MKHTEIEKKTLSFILAFCMMLGLLPGMSLSARAEDAALSVTLGSATKIDDTYYYSSASVTGGGIKTILLSFSQSVAAGDKIILPAAPDGFVVSSTSATNDYTKRINIDSGTDADTVQSYLRGIGYQLANSSQSVKITLTTENILYDTFYDIDTQHYYQYVSGETAWTDAYNAAKGMSYMGRTGYLATITSPNEDIFVNSLSGGKVGWLGGTIMNNTGESSNNLYYNGFDTDAANCLTDWYWACGPECGDVFYSGRTNDRTNNSDGTSPYWNWYSGEPNYAQNKEDCLTTLPCESATGNRTGKHTSNFSWNDIYEDDASEGPYAAQGYFVEFGNKKLSDSTTSVTGYTSATGTLSSSDYVATISGSPASGQTLTAQESGGGTISGYQWVRDDGAISVATSQTYTLTDDDVGHMISVKITVDGAFVQSPQVGPVTTALKPALTATADSVNNCVNLSWIPGSADDHYMVYQKDSGEEIYQSIPVSTDIKVLNVYPDATGSDSLKTWMDTYGSPTVNGVSYTMTVTKTSLTDFNINYANYLTPNTDGSYNYDVIYFGAWDTNNNMDLSDNALATVKAFIDYGGGCLLGHDTESFTHTNFINLAKTYLNMDVDYQGEYNTGGLNSAYQPIGDTKVLVHKKGMLTNYPYSLGDVGTVLTTPLSHSYYEFAMGDVWFTYQSNTFRDQPIANIQKNVSKGGIAGTNNFYLTTWNNCAAIQTGHSGGEAYPDEQRILTNTLYYLAQVTKNTSATDHMAQDLAAPNAVNSTTVAAKTSGDTTLSWTAPSDNGSTYDYYVREFTADGSSLVDSDTKSATVTTGVDKYYYLVDQSSANPPAGVVKAENHSTTVSTNISAGTLSPGDYYVHILAVDTAGNESAVTTASFTVASAPPVAGSGKALSFDGADDYVDIPSNSALTTNAFTAEAWVQYSTDQKYQWCGIIDKGRTPYQNWWILTTGDTSRKGVVVGIAGNATPQNDIEYDWDDSNWHYVTITFDGSSFCLYVDGILRGSIQVTGHPAADTNLTMGTGNSGRAYTGQLDEVKLWNTARTADEIQSDMYSHPSSSEPDLVGYWSLDEGPGSTASDSSASGADGTLTNMDTSSAWISSEAWLNRTTAQDTALVMDAGYTPDGGSVTLAAATGPSHGTLSFNDADKTVIYTPSPNYSGTDSFTYTVTENSVTKSYSVIMTVEQAPVMTGPSDLTAAAGASAAFTVTVSAPSSGLSYQWQKYDGSNWNAITTATAATYTINSVSSDSAGKYRCVVTATDGTIAATTISGQAVLTVTFPVTVSNDGNGTGSASPATATMGDEVTLTATPTAGYHFKEWQVLSGGVTVTNDKFTMPAEAVEVKAIFEVNTFTATVNIKLNDVPSDAPLTGTAVLKKEGSPDVTLAGNNGTYAATVVNGVYDVYINGESTGVKVTIAEASGSATVDYYTLNFSVSNAGAAIGSGVAATAGGTSISNGATVLKGKQVVLSATGAGVGDDAQSPSYTYAWSGDGISGTPTTQSVTIDSLASTVNAACAVTGSATYKVTLNVNGGKIISGDISSYAYGTGATLPTNVTKTGYFFGGWYDNENLTGSAETAITVTDKGAKTFYAQWTAKPPVAGSGDALSFDGTDDFVDLGESSVKLILGNTFTEEIWVYPSETDTEYHGIIGNQIDGDSITRAPGIWVFDHNKVHIGFGNGTKWEDLTITDAVLTSDKWNHIAAVYDGNTYYLYINGVLKAQKTLNATPCSTPVRFIGQVDNSFKGQLDEVKLWETARTQAEIQADMYSHPSSGATGLVGYWSFDEGSGSTASDSSANCADGTLTNMDTSSSAWISSEAWQNRTTAQDSALVMDAGYTWNGGSVTLEKITAPAHGTLSFNDTYKTVTYTPTGGYSGSDAFTYSVTNSAGTNNYTVDMTIVQNPIMTGPENITAAAGSSASFTVSVSAPLTGLSYQWQKYDGSNWNNITDATTATYTISSVTAGDAGQYKCIVTNTDGTTTAVSTSGEATLTVTFAATVAIKENGSASADPVTGNVELKQSTETKATLSGISGIYTANVVNGTYSVFVNGVDTAKTVTINNGAGNATVDYYTVSFSASDSGAASGSTVTAAAGGTSISSGATVLAGKKIELTATGAGASYYSYFWSGSGANGQTSDSVTISSLSLEINALCTVTGKSSPMVYSVSLNTNGGSISSGSIVSYTYGTGTKLPSDVTREGFIFAGWYADSDFSGSAVTEISVTQTGDKTFYAKWRYYTVDGTVVDEDNKAIHGATVTIRGNNITKQTQTTDTDGKYSFSNIPKGEYNIIATYNDVTTTIIISVVDEDISDVEIVMPTVGAENSVVTVADDTPDVVVGYLDQQFSDSDDTYVSTPGNTVKLELSVEEKSKEEVSDAEVIQAKAGSRTIDMYLKMELTKIKTGAKKSEDYPSSVDSLLKIIIPYNLSGKTNVVVYRVHEDTTAALKEHTYSESTPFDECYMVDSTNNLVIVWAKNFSTYAIAYSNYDNSSSNYAVTSSAGTGGTISPSGSVSVTAGASKTFAITANYGYVISDVLVDGKSVGAVSSYTFAKVTASQTISAVFSKSEGLPYYLDSGNKVFIGFAEDTSGEMKYIAPEGTAVLFTPNPKNFTDISGHWGKSYIDFVTEREIFIGTGINIFSPDTGMTRAMFATVIGRLYERSYGTPIIFGDHAFTDCDYESWYGSYIDWCSENGIIEGVGEGLFEPDREITRQEMAAILYRFAEFLKVSKVSKSATLRYPDSADIAIWAEQAALYCQETGIIEGRDAGNFVPQGTATRSEVAAILERFIKKVV